MATVVPWQESVFFKDSPERALDRLKGSFKEVPFRSTQRVFKEGDTASSLYILKSGRVELTYTLPTRPDANVRITHIHPGEVFAWSALTGGNELTATAVATEDSEVFVLPAEQLRSAMDEDPTFGYQIMDRLATLVASRLLDTRQQLQWLNSF